METKEYIVRIEGTANYYGLGERINEYCALFSDGNYGLTKTELNAKLKALGKVTLG